MMLRTIQHLCWCFFAVGVIAALSIALAVHQIFLHQDTRTANTELQRDIYYLKQEITQLQHELNSWEEPERVLMFKKHLDRTSNALTEQDLKILAERTMGLSEGEIAVIFSGALMKQIRMVRSATHFKKVRGPSPLDSTKIVDDLMTPCSPGDDGAFKMAWNDVPKDKLLEPPITMIDMLQSLASTKANDDGDIDM